MEHPAFFLQDKGCFHGPDGIELNLSCGACFHSFTKSQVGNTPEFTMLPDDRWCYQGPHTVDPVEEGDNRRVFVDEAHIGASSADDSDLFQTKISQLDGSAVRILSMDGYFHSHADPVMDISMSLLEEVKLINVNFQKLVFNAETTPKLRTLLLQHLPEECSIEIKCPNLTHVEINYVYGFDWVQEMLDAAQQLVDFKSHKLELRELHFASPALRTIKVYRADLCYNVSVWAPRLLQLKLLACHDLAVMTFPTKHPSLGSWDDRDLSEFYVDTTNSILSSRVKEALYSNPRVHWDGPTDFSV